MQRRRRRARPPCALRVREYCRQFVAFMFSNVGVIGLVVAYTVAGAFIFQAIEGSSEVERVLRMARSRERTAQRLWRQTAVPLNVFDETLWKINVSAELQEYQKTVVKAIRNGWDGSDRTQVFRQWSFPRAFLYSLTVLTTIGYGNISPRTPWGKVTTMLYAMIGMPLFLLYLTNIGDLLARSFKWFYMTVCLCRGCPGVARRRATRLRMQIQAQLGEPMDALTYAARVEAQRRRSAPEWQPEQRCSGYLEALPCSGASDGRGYHSHLQRGVSEPCSPRHYELEDYPIKRDRFFKRNDDDGLDIDEREEDYCPNTRGNNRKNERSGKGIEAVHDNPSLRIYNSKYGKRGLRLEQFDRGYSQELEQYSESSLTDIPEIERMNITSKARQEFNINSDVYRGTEEIKKLDRSFPPARHSINQLEFKYQVNGHKGNELSSTYEFDNGNPQFNRRILERRPPNNERYRISNENESEFWRRSNNLGNIENSSENRDYDPMDNYGEYELYGNKKDETAESDEFTYITIDSQNVTVPITICVIIMVVYIFFGAMLFSMWEDWNRVDGSYFCFISLTSIGFGDIVPGERIYARAARDDDTKRIDTSFILCSIYLLFGMALIAMCFNLMQEQVVQYLAGAKRVLRRVCRCKR